MERGQTLLRGLLKLKVYWGALLWDCDWHIDVDDLELEIVRINNAI